MDNNNSLLRVSLRLKAIYLDVDRETIDMQSVIQPSVMAFVGRLRNNGFCVSEELLHALNAVGDNVLNEITDVISDVLGLKLNWAPLVKGWNIPTGESVVDHLVTYWANYCCGKVQPKGTVLPCCHLIPEGTFPIERYNGCPFCGTPFRTADYVFMGQNTKLKELRLFNSDDIKNVFLSLLNSNTPLDATQKDSLEMLLEVLPIPESATIKMKETAMLVVDKCVKSGKPDKALNYLKTPTDILRYLWYKQSGHVQIIEPKILIQKAKIFNRHIAEYFRKSSAEAGLLMKESLMLKYSRTQCAMVANWLNDLDLTPEECCEIMNPKRGMWVRFIHALRLGEYSRRPGYEQLADILDVFYNQKYQTWQGKVDKAKKDYNQDSTLKLLKQRPGLFARCLFSTMLRFNPDDVLKAFDSVSDQLPARLLVSLGNGAETYFNRNAKRIAKPITGGTYPLESNKLLENFREDYLELLADKVQKLYAQSMFRRYQKAKTDSKTIFIDDALYNIPLSVGDRSTTIQDTSCALMGTRFKVEGDSVRLFLQWGKGLKAQHLDMDLSCRIFYKDGKFADCAYYELDIKGAKHSGDIRHIPDLVGTAEYIELDLNELQDAKYVMFTCNSYSCGTLSPNLVVGWMNCEFPMKVSDATGVAYDPSCVQHQVRISENNLSKGLVFGVLDVESREIIWLEMPFDHQTIGGANFSSVSTFMKQLEAKTKIGDLLELKASAQNLEKVSSPDLADEAYTYEWALNPAEVTRIMG